MTTTPCVSTDAQYAKALEVWRLLFEAEQLIVNDDEYRHVQYCVANALTAVSIKQTRLEQES